MNFSLLAIDCNFTLNNFQVSEKKASREQLAKTIEWDKLPPAAIDSILKLASYSTEYTALRDLRDNLKRNKEKLRDWRGQRLPRRDPYYDDPLRDPMRVPPVRPPFGPAPCKTKHFWFALVWICCWWSDCLDDPFTGEPTPDHMTPPDWGTAVISIASIMFTLRFFTIFFSIDRDRQPPPYGPTPGHGYDPFSPFNPNPPGLPRPGMKLLRLFFFQFMIWSLDVQKVVLVAEVVGQAQILSILIQASLEVQDICRKERDENLCPVAVNRFRLCVLEF